MWRNGRRDGLKIRCPQGRGGSSPFAGMLDIMNVLIGQKLAKLRQQKGLTLNDVAKKVGISAVYISLLERGLRKNPSKEVLKRLVSLYGVSETSLLKPGSSSPPVEDDSGDIDYTQTQVTPGAIPKNPQGIPVSVRRFLESEDADFLRPSAGEIRILVAWARKNHHASPEEVMFYLIEKVRPSLPKQF